jgi:hypothetical protein
MSLAEEPIPPHPRQPDRAAWRSIDVLLEMTLSAYSKYVTQQ